MTDVVSFSAQDKWLWLSKPWLHLDKESTCSPGTSWPMDQIHSTMWIFILSFINTSLPGSRSTPTPFFPSILSQKTLITLQSYQGTPDSRNTAHSRGKGVSKPLFTAGRGGEQSSIHLILGAWYFCRDQRWSPLHGFSARTSGGSYKTDIFSKPGNIPTLWTVSGSWGYIHKTFPDY